MKRIGVVVLVAAAAGTAAVASSAAESPQALRASMFAAARAQRSVHYVDRSTLLGGPQTMVGDVGRTRGIQRITFRRDGASGNLTILVVKGTVYIRGNAAGLTQEGDLSPQQAIRYAHRWILVPHGEYAYEQLADEVTLGTFLREQVPLGHLTLVGGMVGGRKVVGVRGSGAVMTQTVYARSGARHLPLEVVGALPSQRSRHRVSMDRWNERLFVHAPPHAVSMAKVVGA